MRSSFSQQSSINSNKECHTISMTFEILNFNILYFQKYQKFTNNCAGKNSKKGKIDLRIQN